MNKKSNVNTTTILKENKYLEKLKKIQFSGYSLWELKHNKRVKTGKELRPSPSRIIQHFKNYKLIHSVVSNKYSIHQGPSRKHLKGMLSVCI